MGNSIITGSADLTLDDIYGMWKEQKKQRAVQAKGLWPLPPEVEERFRGITNHLKVFRFSFPALLSNPQGRVSRADPSLSRPSRGLSTSSGKRSGKASPVSGKASPRLVVEPLDVGSSNLRIRRTETYLLINICQTLPGFEAAEGETGAKGPGEELPSPVFANPARDLSSHSWAGGMLELFTPRGLASSVYNHLASPTAPSVGGEGETTRDELEGPTGKFTYSLHVFKGADAHPLGPCEAVSHALKLDAYFSADFDGGQQLLQRLFFNFGRDLPRYEPGWGSSSSSTATRIQYTKASFSNAKPRKIAEELIHWRPSLFGSFSPTGGGGAKELFDPKTICELNALLYALQIVRGSPRYDPALRDSYLKDGAIPSDGFFCPPLPSALTAKPRRKGHPETSKSPPKAPRVPYPLEIPWLTLDKLPNARPVGVGKATSPAKPSSERPGLASNPGSTSQPMLPSLWGKKAEEQGGDPYGSSFGLNESSDSTRTPPAPRYVRPPRITTPIPLAERIRTRCRSSLHLFSSKWQAADPGTAEPPIPPLSLKGTSTTGAAAVAKVNLADLDEGAIRTDSDDRQDRARRLCLAAPEASEVLPWLFVGGEEPARNRALLLSKGITAVVNTVAFAIPSQFTDVFLYLSLCTSDSPEEPITSLFPLVNRFIDEEHFTNGGKVFIHCQQGVSRSCSFVIAYIMWFYGMCYDRAYELVHLKRGICSPNAGFYVKLRLWEQHLTRPTFNRGYVYAPYSKCFPLPFVFHFALDCNPSSASTTSTAPSNNGSLPPGTRASIEEESKVLGGFSQIVKAENPSVVLDKRLSYGFLFGHHDSLAEGQSSASLDTLFYIGSECDQTVAAHARDEWVSFLYYSFYTSGESRSVNNRGEDICFSPIPGISIDSLRNSQPNPGAPITKNHLRSVPIVKDLSRLENRLSTSLWGEQKAPDGSSILVRIHSERDPRWDELLNQPGLIFEFASALGRSSRLQVAAESRKRIREEELHQNRTSGGRFSTNVFVAERNAKSAHRTGKEEPAPSRSAANLDGAIASSSSSPGLRDGDSPALQKKTPNGLAASPLPSSKVKNISDPNATLLEEQNHTQEFNIAFLRYPFDVPPIFTDLPTLEELQEDECWAIAVTGNSLIRPNALYLWLGENCGFPPEAVIETFKLHLVGNPKLGLKEAVKNGQKVEERHTIRIGEFVMEDVVVQLVYQGEEPDELVLFL
ncbi:unnamed protein product [Phytomonas sp. Hart1]|nr:unnamed protein product [Phytomonas sp. Hart1]|eukprot:CCW70501.1 unnamed protein product [Phytomonas sp. isolate Hart1]